MTTRYIISCGARTGSTLLVHLLRSHPRIMSHGEVFVRERVGPLDPRSPHARTDRGTLWQWRQHDPPGFLSEVVFDAAGLECVGLKFKHGQAFGKPWEDIQRLIAADPDVRIVRLRRDPLQQFVSHQVVKRRGGRAINLRKGEKRPVVEPFAATRREAIAYARESTDRERMADEAYVHHPQVFVPYDRLLEPATQERLCAFLGVAPKTLSTSTEKVLPDGPSLLLNRDEIENALASVYEAAGFPVASWLRQG